MEHLTLLLCVITGAVMISFLLTLVGLKTAIPEDVLDQLDTLDTLEDRIREARIYMAEKPSFPAEDYDYLCRILDPEDTYKYNNLNDF